MDVRFPEAWRQAITEWAVGIPEIAAVYLFGSRAKGTSREDSDIDLAYLTQPIGSETAFTVAFFNEQRWQEQLQALLPVPIDLQYADPDGDLIVWPSVQDHGIRLY